MMVHRALFQLQAHGHDRDRVHLMDGSLEDWKQAGGPLDQEATQIPSIKESKEDTQYAAQEPGQVVDIEEVNDLNAKLQLALLSYSDHLEDIQTSLEEQFNYELVYCAMESGPGKPSHFIAIRMGLYRR